MPEGCDENGPAGETYRRIGVSAFAEHHQLRRELLVITAVSKAVLLPQTPIRQYADTLPQPAHFQRNPPGRGRLAVFPRCSLDPYESRYGRFARALKNSQLTCGDITIICETMH